ncbi:unnamed protein product [Nezara viridula]|uniref:Uncharacterized protein n=1 Tax=Nezara viridula TaxID=85310 RepID=A0A9P0MTW7_NEZVI|nr:unnamed protein product [Nezara viridula]
MSEHDPFRTGGSYFTSPRVAVRAEDTWALQTPACFKKLKLVWVPGNKGVTDNEKAGKLAHNSAQPPFMGSEPRLGVSKNRLH